MPSRFALGQLWTSRARCGGRYYHVLTYNQNNNVLQIKYNKPKKETTEITEVLSR